MIWAWRGKWEKTYLPSISPRVVIACPGPSLKNTKITQGPHRTIIGINTSYPTIRPDIWIGMDETHCYDLNMLAESFPKIYRGTYAEMEHGGKAVKKTPSAYFADCKQVPAGKTMLDLLHRDQPLAWHSHTLGVALHFAFQHGAREVYLAGCDMGGSSDYCHGLKLTDEQRSRNQLLYGQQIEFIRKLALAAEKYGITLQSCTPDSPINKHVGYTAAETIMVGATPSAVRYVTDKPLSSVAA